MKKRPSFLNFLLSLALAAVQDVFCQEIVELFGLGVVLLIAAERNDNIAFEIRIGNFEKPDAFVVHFAPREFRPKAHANASSDSFLDDSSVIAF